MTTQHDTSRSTRVNLSITEERLAWLDEYAASKRWHRSTLIAELIDGFRARLAAKETTSTPASTKSALRGQMCFEGRHERGPALADGSVTCTKCPGTKVGSEWAIRS